MKMLVLFLFCSALLVHSKSTCDGFTTSDKCLSKTVLGVHSCVWCSKDRECHDVGSPYDGCTDNCCASQSSLSTCKWHSAADIPQSCSPVVPEQIHLAYAGKTANGNPNGMTVSWFTQLSTPTSTVKYGETESNLNQVATASKPCVSYINGYGFHHHVEITGLTPQTVYYYQVGDPSESFSSVFTLTTASDETSKGYSMAIFGDMGYLGSKERGPMVVPAVGGLESNWTAVPTHDMLMDWKKAGAIDSMLIVGDIGYADDAFAYSLSFAYESVFSGYMNWMMDMAADLPFMVTPGNHESECHSPACVVAAKYHEPLRNFSAYNARFAMPSGSSAGVQNMWYSFNKGPVHWISINSETDWAGAAEETHGDSGIFRAGGFGADGEYLRWLENDLMQANSERALRPWIIAYGHRPIGEVNESHGTLFDKYGLDAYFAGHKHSYARSGPTTVDDSCFSLITHLGRVDKKAMLNDNHYHQANGRLYVVVGSAGCDEMDYVADPITGEVTTRKRVPDMTHVLPAGSAIPIKGITSHKVSAGVLTVHNSSALTWELYDSTSRELIDSVLLTK